MSDNPSFSHMLGALMAAGKCGVSKLNLDMEKCSFARFNLTIIPTGASEEEMRDLMASLGNVRSDNTATGPDTPTMAPLVHTDD